jgi:hypothetical protein
MTKDIINDLTDKGTKRLNTKPLLKAGHKFILMCDGLCLITQDKIGRVLNVLRTN